MDMRHSLSSTSTNDSLISAQTQAVEKLKPELQKHFQCKFHPPKDFLGLDITNPRRGEITLGMHSFTTKMQDTLKFQLKHEGPVLTPGRTDKKVIRGVDIEKDDQYRSKVGILNWLTMGMRYDLVYTTKELSRVLAEPTKIAREIVDRAIEYTIKTKHAHLVYSHTKMTGYIPPKTRKKPTDNATKQYEVPDYNHDDGITQCDDIDSTHEYVYKGEHLPVKLT
jgi:hypothetical protein